MTERLTNCPNCGAPLHGDICEYCGTVAPWYEEKVQAYKSNLMQIQIEIDSAAQTQYILESMGKWTSRQN